MSTSKRMSGDVLSVQPACCEISLLYLPPSQTLPYYNPVQLDHKVIENLKPGLLLFYIPYIRISIINDE